MVKWIRVLFGYDPPMGKWIDYGDYVMKWRKDWADRVMIADYDKERDRIKLELVR